MSTVCMHFPTPNKHLSSAADSACCCLCYLGFLGCTCCTWEFSCLLILSLAEKINPIKSPRLCHLQAKLTGLLAPNVNFFSPQWHIWAWSSNPSYTKKKSYNAFLQLQETTLVETSYLGDENPAQSAPCLCQLLCCLWKRVVSILWFCFFSGY